MPLSINLSDSLEKIPVEIFKTPHDGSLYVAQVISVLIKEKNSLGKKLSSDWQQVLHQNLYMPNLYGCIMKKA
jgi:hypothetical protein